MPPVEAKAGRAYDRRMKACLFSAALICSAVAISTCLAAERSAVPAAATDGHPAANTAGHADGHQTPSSGEGGSSVQAPSDATGERRSVDDRDKSVSKPSKPDAQTPPAGPNHAHGPRQLTGPSRHDDNAKPANPIDTRITVNQGRTPENSKKGPVYKQEGPSDKTSRANSSQGIHVPHSMARPGAVHAPTRNAIGEAPNPNGGAPLMGAPAFPGPVGAKSPLPAPRGANSPGVRPRGEAAVGGIGSIPGASGPRVGHPMVPGSAGINGTGIAHGALRVGEIGGPARNNGGITGSNVRAKRP
jgi:hypothetical protein